MLRDRPLILFSETGSQGCRVTACSTEAARSGVQPGWPLAEARAMFSRPVPTRSGRRNVPSYQRRDLSGDRQALEGLALRCQQFSPFVGLEEEDEPESLWLDITGCAPLWHDERGLLSAIIRDLAALGCGVRAAIADTLGAAWALAHYGPSFSIAPVKNQEKALRPLPIRALRVSEAAVKRLDELGIATIGQLLELPRASLPSRFGPDLAHRLDQALGHISETFLPQRFAEPLVETWRGDDAIPDQQALVMIFRRLLQRLVAGLSLRRAGIAELHCALRTDAATIAWDFHLSRPTTDAAHLEQLFRLRCEQEAWPGGVVELRLEIRRAGPLDERQPLLFEDGRYDADRELAVLVDRLTSRLGERSVVRPVFVPDPQPECICQWEPWLRTSATAKEPFHSDPLAARCRPWRLLAAPEAVHATSIVPEGPPLRVFWRGRNWAILRSWGPERIETGWWRSRDVQRDYYRVETEHGPQLWLFRQRGTDEWFLHGFFD